VVLPLRWWHEIKEKIGIKLNYMYLTKEEKKRKKQWQKDKQKTAEGKKILTDLITVYGKYKHIQIIDWDGKTRYFRVSTKRIIIKSIKAKKLLANKYGKEISKKEFEGQV